MTKASEYLARYVEYAGDPSENGLSWHSPLSVEINGKYVDVLFCTGGPHFDIQFEYEDAEDAEYWQENEPSGAVAHYGDWGESEYIGVSRYDATLIAYGINRDPESLGTGEDQ